MEKTNVANMHQNIVQTNEQTNAQTNAQTAENNIAQSTELNFNHNAEQNFVQTTEQNMHQNTEPSLKRNAVQSKEQAAEQSTVQNTEPSLKRKSYFLKLVVMTFIVTPLVIQLSQVLVFFISDGGSLFPSTFDLLTITLLASTPGFVATVLMWWRWAKNVRENLVPKSLAMRFFPQLLIFAGGLAIWAIVCYFSGFSYRGDLWWLLLVLDFPYFITIVAEIFMTRPDIYLYIKLVQLIITIIVPSAVFAYRRISFRADRRLLITGGAAAALMAVIGVELWQRSLRFIDNGSALDKEAIVGKEVDLTLYQPFQANSELPRVSDPDVLINSEWPKLDGATAAYPVFAAVAQSIYKGMNLENVSEYVNCSNTIGAYERLNAGEIDIFFGAQPSNSQLQDAISAGIQYEMTALGHEAFVFFVHKDNPINNLSLEQIRDIYTKRVTNWSDLGGNFEQIIAYQRNADSGSQTIMQSKVMNKEPMAEPLRDEQINFMGRIVDDVAEYRNGTAAIGYSFRFYVTGMKKTEDVKLLAIDGIEPSKENIRNGSYPLTIEFFAITAGNKNPNVSELLIWLQAEQGQQLIEDCGYVGL